MGHHRKDPMTLIKKRALVCGGTGGLGSVVAQRLCAEGCSVAVSYRNEEDLYRLPQSLRDRAKSIKADVTDEGDVQRLYDVVTESFAGVDIVVNTVGGYLAQRLIADTSNHDWDLMMSINLKSAFLSTREALRRMKGRSYGRIINIGAMVGLTPTPGRAAYAISKAGVSLLTDLAAQEVKGSGITVNAIAPSIIATQANLESMPGEDSTMWVTPDQIADLISFLCSPSASAITGTTVKAYGGV
jgi:NAD(P)-dependent dehydrogenase (short-subunit alcohol dehydrogenase family)